MALFIRWQASGRMPSFWLRLCRAAPWRLCVKEFNGMDTAWSVVRSLLPVVPCSLISAFQISKFQRFRLDPQPSPCGIAAIIPRGETLNHQPSSHHVPNVIMDVPPWEILKLGPAKENWAVVLAATSSLRPGAFLKWHPNQVPKVNHDVLCRYRQDVGDSAIVHSTLRKGNEVFKTNKQK